MLFESDDGITTLAVAPDGKRFLLHLAPIETQPMRVVLHGLPVRGETSKGTKR